MSAPCSCLQTLGTSQEDLCPVPAGHARLTWDESKPDVGLLSLKLLFLLSGLPRLAISLGNSCEQHRLT